MRASLPAAFILLAVAAALPADTVRAAPPTRLRYVIKPVAHAPGRVDVRVEATGVAADADWSMGLPRAGGVSAIKRESRGGVVTVDYQVALASLAARFRDPDVATSVPGGTLFHDGALLMRPDDLPRDARVDITVNGTVPVSSAWSAGADPRSFVLDGERLDGGAYVLWAPHHRVPASITGGELEVVSLAPLDDAQRVRMGRWVSRSAQVVADFMGGSMPVARTHVILHAQEDSSAAPMFGTTLRWGHGSVVLYVGARAPEAALQEDWVAPHELFHLSNPVLDQRTPWLIEGVTTYYQEVLRARGGMKSADAAWRSIINGAKETCGEAQEDTLLEASRTLRQTHAWTRVYWGGACAALVADVVLRAEGGSLDAVLRDWRHRSLQEPLDADALADNLVASVSSPWGRAWVKAALSSREALPLGTLWSRLGLREGAPPDEKAPWSHIRRDIMTGGSTPAARVEALPPPR